MPQWWLFDSEPECSFSCSIFGGILLKRLETHQRRKKTCLYFALSPFFFSSFSWFRFCFGSKTSFIEYPCTWQCVIVSMALHTCVRHHHYPSFSYLCPSAPRSSSPIQLPTSGLPSSYLSICYLYIINNMSCVIKFSVRTLHIKPFAVSENCRYFYFIKIIPVRSFHQVKY